MNQLSCAAEQNLVVLNNHLFSSQLCEGAGYFSALGGTG